LVENHREFLRFLERRVGSRAVAEDILHDAFVKSFDRLASLRNEESAVAWFYRVLRNAVTDHRRRLGATERKLDAFAGELEATEIAQGDVGGAICQCISELAGTLKPEDAEILKRVELDGVSVKDFAAQASISSGNAAVRIFRAREALRRQVTRSCGTCAEHGCVDCSCGG
jgi:RNA polymerase sigma-70 factor (ECF subfamily)